MTTFELDAYKDDKQVKWIVAQRIAGDNWVGRYLVLVNTDGTTSHYPTLDNVLENTPIGEMRRSEFAVFKNSPRIWDAKPRLYWRGPEVPVHLNGALSGFVNAVNSDFTINGGKR
jgi:hypothetical protein